MKIPPIGLQLFTVRESWQSDPGGTLRQLAKIGYQQVELFFHELDANGRIIAMPAKDLAGLLKDSGLSVFSSHAPSDPGADWNHLIDYNMEIGSSGIGIGAAFYENLADAYRLADCLNEKAELCRRSGLDFYYHNHYHEFQRLEGKMIMDVLLEKATGTQLELDVFWTTRAGLDPVNFMQEHAARIGSLHFKDMSKETAPIDLLQGAVGKLTPEIVFTAAKPTDFVEVGAGCLKLEDVLRQALQLPKLKGFILEQDFTPKGELESAALSFRKLQELMTSIS